MCKIYVLFLNLAIAIVFSICCNLTQRKYGIELITYETDIEGLSVQLTDDDKNGHFTIMIIQEPYVKYWLSCDYSVFFADSGEEIQIKENHGFPEVQILLEKDTNSLKGSAVKEYWLDMFDFQCQGEYIIHNELYKENLEHFGILNLRVKIVPNQQWLCIIQSLGQ